MSPLLSGVSRRALLKFVLVASSLLAIILAAGLSVGAYGGRSSSTVGNQQDASFYRPAVTQDTFYNDNYAGDDLEHKRERMQIYRQHIDDHFRLSTREMDNQLQLIVHIPSTYAAEKLEGEDALTRMHNAVADDTIDFQLRENMFFYNTVRRVEDCNNRLFLRHYAMQVEDPSTVFSLPLSASDYGRYYCIKIGLRVSQPGFNRIPWKVFVTERSVSSPGVGDSLADYPGFARTVMQSTSYDWYGSDLAGNQAMPERERYYRHLNENFSLYSRQTAGRLHLRIDLPDAFDIPGRPDIKDFEIKKLEYVVVRNAADCDRPAFESGVTEYQNPMAAMSLYPEAEDYTDLYCLKITLRGERKWSSDRHPYRIFLVPQRITTVAPTAGVGNIWRSL